MLKKILLSTLCALCIAGSVLAATALSDTPNDFSNITADTYPIYWKQGEQFKSNKNQENPELFSCEWRSMAANMISVSTPKMIVNYLSFSHKERLIELPSNLENTMIKNNDTAYILTWVPLSSNLLPIPTQHLVIDKNGAIIRPTKMSDELENLMPHSYGLKYYAFPRSVILNVPYTIRWVNGIGEMLSKDITSDNINSLIDCESHLYNAK